MSVSFSFSDGIPSTDDYLALGQLTSDSTAVASGQLIDPSDDVDVIAVTLIAGQRYLFDIDQGYGDSSGGSVNVRIDLIDAEGRLVLGQSTADRVDSGSFSDKDPYLGVEVFVTGTYYIAVHSENVNYIKSFFGFEGGSTGQTGDYTLSILARDIPDPIYLTSSSDDRTYLNRANNVHALSGDDELHMGGGNDIAAGDDGEDRLHGDEGDDELSGGDGSDRLVGGDDADVLIGGFGGDTLQGGGGADALNGGSGADSLFGGKAADHLMGNSGSDTLEGGRGSDFIRGGTGIDRMDGGTGADTFHFLRGEAAFDTNLDNGIQEDRIVNFRENDLVDLTDLYLGQLTWRGTRLFNDSNQVRILDLGSTIGVQVNLDSNQSSRELAFIIDPDSGVTVDKTDFLL